MEGALSSFLAENLEAEAVEVSGMQRIPGGASRQTWSFQVRWIDGAGAEQSSSFILQRDASVGLVESERPVEFAFYETVHAAGIPVPEVLWLEPSGDVLGDPFFIMEYIPGVEGSPQTLLSPGYAEAAPRVGVRMYEILGAIHRVEWRGTPIESAVDAPTVESTAEREVAYWEDMIDRHELSPQPIARAAIRWLRDNPPPAAQRITVVHGDYRVGNVLYDDAGNIPGVVDWEMAHLGDPLEDLAWGFLKTWEWARDGRKGGVIDEARAIAIYEEASGITVDRDALHWWDVFNGVKAQGIWLTSAHAYESGGSNEPVLAMTPYWLVNLQDEFLLQSLGRLA
jgi:aminoglycoside phosphotransferase (APT) family kinase protein